MMRSLLFAGMMVFALGCSGSVEEGDNAAGASGTAGTGGSAGTGGTAGSGGSAGTGGSAGGAAGQAGSGGSTGGSAGQAGSGGSTGGSAGQAGSGGSTGGSAGQAGSGGSTGGAAGSAGSGGGPIGPECTDASTCTLHSDCCSCVALPPGEEFIPCPATCFVDKCTELGLDPQKPTECQVGQCVVGFNCDWNQIACASPSPICAAGEVASVRNGCWGPCVPATDCSSVTDCSACDATTQVCVSNVAWTVDNHCVEVPPQCQGNATCGCMEEAVCIDSFGLCFDGPDDVISCECPTC